jgi:hypothetical protein
MGHVLTEVRDLDLLKHVFIPHYQSRDVDFLIDRMREATGKVVTAEEIAYARKRLRAKFARLAKTSQDEKVAYLARKIVDKLTPTRKLRGRPRMSGSKRSMRAVYLFCGEFDFEGTPAIDVGLKDGFFRGQSFPEYVRHQNQIYKKHYPTTRANTNVCRVHTYYLCKLTPSGPIYDLDTRSFEG